MLICFIGLREYILKWVGVGGWRLAAGGWKQAAHCPALRPLTTPSPHPPNMCSHPQAGAQVGADCGCCWHWCLHFLRGPQGLWHHHGSAVPHRCRPQHRLALRARWVDAGWMFTHLRMGGPAFIVGRWVGGPAGRVGLPACLWAHMHACLMLDVVSLDLKTFFSQWCHIHVCRWLGSPGCQDWPWLQLLRDVLWR